MSFNAGLAAGLGAGAMAEVTRRTLGLKNKKKAADGMLIVLLKIFFHKLFYMLLALMI